jgi:hypothetical protein
MKKKRLIAENAALLDCRPVAAVLDFGLIRLGVLTCWFSHLYIGVDGAVRGVDLAPIPLLMVLLATKALAMTFHLDPAFKTRKDTDD